MLRKHLSSSLSRGLLPRSIVPAPKSAPSRALKPVIVLTLALLSAAAPLHAGGSRAPASPPAPSSAAPAGREVVVWTYDSFLSEWGPGAEVKRRFEAETGINLRWVSHGDAGALLSRLLLEGADADADAVLGLDQNLAPRALSSGLFAPYKPRNADAVPAELLLDADFRLTPFDYSYFAVVYDSERVSVPPRSLEDLTRSAFARRLILMDPRTSSPGLGFLLWTRAVYGEGWRDYWRRLAPSVLTVADGWDSGYGLFTAGEAPLVLSYTTSPGYHLEYEGTERYKAALFEAGHPAQTEAAGVLQAAAHGSEARAFLDFTLTAAFQELMPLGNWMYPATPVPLPPSFRVNAKPAHTLRPPALTDAELAALLTEWAALMQ